jgi:hypothetical protein
VDRYSELRILAPTHGSELDGGVVSVQARLMPRAGMAPEYPDRLAYRVVRSEGGTVVVEGSAMGVGSGTYSAQWTPPAQDGVFDITAAHPVSGGPSATVRVAVDKTPPVLSVVVPAALAPQADGGFAYLEPGAGMTPSWRRDQTVQVQVKTEATDVEPTSLSMRVHGFDGGSDVTDLSFAPVTPCDVASCWSVAVPLWRPGLPAFRGHFDVEVKARDRVGNEGLGTGSIPVTRWKWSFNGSAGSLRSTPAIGQMGTVYFGTSNSDGKVFALNPEGSMKWEKQVGDVVGSPAVGTYTSGSELVYVGANSNGTGVLYALGINGNEMLKCPGAGASGEVFASVALTNTKLDVENSPGETAIALGNGDALLSLRPNATGSRQCISLPLSIESSQGTSIIAKGTDIYLGTTDQVQSYQFSGTGWAQKPGFGSPAIGVQPRGLGFSGGNRVVGSGRILSAGGVFSMVESDGSDLWKYPDPFTLSAPVRNMSIGAGDVLFFGREVASGTAELTAINLGTTTPRSTAPNAGSFPGAPVLGEGGRLYTASSTGATAGIGEVSAWNATDLTRLWRLSENVGRAEASPTLDCTRNPDGTASTAPVGVLYIPSLDGRLYSFVVDSRGLDSTAPWPKYQHDARNTGNPATPISSCQ